MKVPFFRVEITDDERQAVDEVLQSGWLTTGAKVREFETQFAAAVGAKHAQAVNSCTAALHLAVEALNLKAGEGVLVPTMTFAATAEVVRYMGAIPILVDCHADTLNMDLKDARAKIVAVRAGEFEKIPADTVIAGMMPVHVGGWMMDLTEIEAFAEEWGLWIVEDSAHAFPSAWRQVDEDPWRKSGQGTAAVSCFSFYANKTITTGEGGMAVTDRDDLAERLKIMSLHGLSKDAWGRYTGQGAWDYRIVAPGFKYNMTDIAAAVGLGQLDRAEAMRVEREAQAKRYDEAFNEVEEIQSPPQDDLRRIHSWHLYPIRLDLRALSVDRSHFVEALRKKGIGFSVHWRPLHLHPYYEGEWQWTPQSFPVASAEWLRRVSLPIFPGMREEEQDRVVQVVKESIQEFRN